MKKKKKKKGKSSRQWAQRTKSYYKIALVNQRKNKELTPTIK